jgi:hypothetical protein
MNRERRERVTELTLHTLLYSALVACGVITLLIEPSPSVERQGGRAIVLGISAILLTAGACGLYGRWRPQVVIEMIGAGVGVVAGLVWTGSLILQTVATGRWAGGAAACFGLSYTVLLLLHTRRIRRRAIAPQADPHLRL